MAHENSFPKRHRKRYAAGALFAVAAMTPGFSQAFAGEVKYSYSDIKDEIVYVGTKKAELYDVAILVNDPALKGSRIKGIEVPAGATLNMTGYSAWLTTELLLEANSEGKKVNVPNICSVSAANINNTIVATFDEPYTIGDDPVYAGYSFTVTEVESMNDNDPAKYPVAVTRGAQAGSLFMHTPRYYLKWGDRSGEQQCSSALRVILEGDFPAVSGGVASVREVKCQYDEPTVRIPLSYASYGSEPISSLTFEYSYQGKTNTAEMKFDKPETPIFGYFNTIELAIPNEFTDGTENMQLILSKINGKENTNSSRTAMVRVSLLTNFPKKRPMVEEYTGLWCGYCPRGYVAMEAMNEEHSDFVGVAIHEGDPMAIMEIADFPSSIGGFPASVIDRSLMQSPMLDILREAWENRTMEYTPVKLDVEIERDASNPRDINVTARYTLVEPPKNEYRLAYMLLADNLSDPGWKQRNYFTDRIEKYLEWFHTAGSAVEGLVYNDVLAMNTPWAGEAGSVPADVEVQKENTHRYTFHTSGVTTLQGVDIIGMAGDNLSAVAMMIDTKTGEVLNSAKAYIFRAGVEGVTADNAVPVEQAWFDIAGRRVAEPNNGIFILRTVYSDGTVKSVKVVK